jgi:hypothetical protein
LKLTLIYLINEQKYFQTSKFIAVSCACYWLEQYGGRGAGGAGGAAGDVVFQAQMS